MISQIGFIGEICCSNQRNPTLRQYRKVAMRVALLNLISTPAAVLPRSGLELSMGLSSEDPMVGRHPSEPYDAYLSVYAPDGAFAERLALGTIAPNRRWLLNVSSLVRPLGFQDDHLVVLHRVPSALAERFGTLEEPVELPDETDYGFFRAYVQYGYPDGGGAHGGVIYEIPHRFNEPGPGGRPSAVLTFTTKIVLSEAVETSVVLLNCSTDPRYRTTAEYRYAVYTGAGLPAAGGVCRVGPFAAARLELRQAIPARVVADVQDPDDGFSHFCFYGICENAAVAVLVLNLAPALRGVSLEHTHPTQGYLMASAPEDQQRIKREAIAGWRTLMVRREVVR